MAISAAAVKKLRQLTGAGMMDCKNALTEANGDMEHAIEIIREKGKLIASKRSDREASEGVVLANISENHKYGTLTVLNCETDFVASNDSFVALARQFADVAVAQQPADLEVLKNASAGDRLVNDLIIEQTAVIGEKIDLSYLASIEAETVVGYIHPGNRLATIVGFNKAGIDVQVGKDVAMQIAAMSPVGIDKEDVAQEIIDKELEIAMEKYRLEGKPENMLEKIAKGSLNKFFKENTLLNQAFIKDAKQSVREYLAACDKDLVVTKFYRYSLDQN